MPGPTYESRNPASLDDTETDPVLAEAKKRFTKAQAWFASARPRWLDDYKFANADAKNGYQWPSKEKRTRDLEDRPTLTINKTRQHNLQIINDAKKNKPAVTVRATGNGATFESAQVFEDVIRHIEYQSNASVHYDRATTFQVNAGMGCLRVVTRYVDEASFDQDIYICGVPDPLTVYWDPDAREPDKSDANFWFLFDDMDRSEFERKYPKYKDDAGQNVLSDDGWMTSDKVRRAEYFRRVEVPDVLYAAPDSQGQMQYIRKSDLGKEGADLAKALEARPEVRSRDTTLTRVEYYMIVGDSIIVEESYPKVKYLGKHIPLVPVIGEETIIDGIMDLKGHTRALIDPQRMYNYWSSSAVEYGALQGKTPWIAPVEAIEELEEKWNNANTKNWSVLPYNSKAEDGTEIKAPMRTDPPQAAPVALAGLQIAQQEFGLVSGQYESSFGQQGNERTGKAINERQRQAETATYHYVDGLGIAIRQVGKILMDLIPKIYDTKRLIQAMGVDNTDYAVDIDPKQQEAFVKRLDHDQKVAQRIFNPNVGRYEVQADIGPGYATRREEAFNAFTLLLTQAPQLVSIIGDILLKAGDFPMADEAAQRLRRMVPAAALGEGPSATEMGLQQQVQQLTKLLTEVMQESAKNEIKLKGKDAARSVQAFDALTKRLKVMLDAKADLGLPSPTVDELRSVVEQSIAEIQNSSLDPVVDSTEAALRDYQAASGNAMDEIDNDKPPVHGARRGADMGFYLRDYASSPNYRRVS